MSLETQLAEFVTNYPASSVPASVTDTTRRVLMASVGAGIGGSGEDGIAPLRNLLRERGGRGTARTFVFGDSLPAHAAAQLNGTVCRALDFCDAMAPGVHFGSSVVPAACAAAELAGGCSGSEFLAALVVGCEVGSRLNLTEAMYNGFDPTGVATVFASAAAAARILKLSSKQTLHALALAFNRCGGSFQSNVDGSLAVRVIQGWVAQAGVECAELAQAGITGPHQFLSGIYGYAHLFGRDELSASSVTAGLGDEWRMNRMVYKKFPSCGATQGMTELTLQLAREFELTPANVAHVEVRLNPYCHRLVGGEFSPGDSPRVNAQFSAQFCVANALVRGASKLPHFRVAEVSNADVQRVIGRVKCVGDPALDARGHSAVDVTIKTVAGVQHHRALDIPPGFYGNPLSDAEHLARFQDCMDYARYPLPKRQVAHFLESIASLDKLPDARVLVDDLIVPDFESGAAN